MSKLRIRQAQDQQAQTWLQQGGIAEELATGDYFRFKAGQRK